MFKSKPRVYLNRNVLLFELLVFLRMAVSLLLPILCVQAVSLVFLPQIKVTAETESSSWALLVLLTHPLCP